MWNNYSDMSPTCSNFIQPSTLLDFPPSDPPWQIGKWQHQKIPSFFHFHEKICARAGKKSNRLQINCKIYPQEIFFFLGLDNRYSFLSVQLKTHQAPPLPRCITSQFPRRTCDGAHVRKRGSILPRVIFSSLSLPCVRTGIREVLERDSQETRKGSIFIHRKIESTGVASGSVMESFLSFFWWCVFECVCLVVVESWYGYLSEIFLRKNDGGHCKPLKWDFFLFFRFGIFPYPGKYRKGRGRRGEKGKGTEGQFPGKSEPKKKRREKIGKGVEMVFLGWGRRPLPLRSCVSAGKGDVGIFFSSCAQKGESRSRTIFLPFHPSCIIFPKKLFPLGCILFPEMDKQNLFVYTAYQQIFLGKKSKWVGQIINTFLLVRRVPEDQANCSQRCANIYRSNILPRNGTRLGWI